MNTNELLTILGIIIAILLLIVILGIREKQKNIKQFKYLINKRYGKRLNSYYSDVKLASIRGYFDRHRDDNSIDDITWADLNMDKVFASMNNTYSSAGEEYLYYRLRTPLFSDEELNKLDSDIEYFESHPSERNNLLLKIRTIGKLEKSSIYNYIEIPSELVNKNSNAVHYLAILVLIFAFLMLFIKTGLGIILFIAVISFNIVSYYNYKSKYERYLMSLKYIMRLYNSGNDILNDKTSIFNESCSDINNLLKGTVDSLRSFAKNSKYVFISMSNSGSFIDVLANYINMLIHIDLIMFNKMLTKLNDKGQAVDNLITCIGYYETIIALGSYRKSFEGEYCKPEFNQELSAKNAFHPLVDNPVKNDYATKKSILITGSNASGKSTFLRTVAINQLLSQTINMALADEYKTDFYKIYSSISLADDIIKGDSYFMAEIKALGRILDATTNCNHKIICFVDEVLRGTNTVERIAASSQVLKYLAENNILCFAATHDIELTELLDGIFINYHFKEDIDNGDVKFSYKLLNGKAESRNAIKLLESIGYDSSIVDKATKMADNFVQKRFWEMIE